MKMGRFVVDGHIHCGKKDTAKEDSPISGIQSVVESEDNSDMALYDMDCYDIDMGILLPSFTGTSNELYADICRRHPDRFRTCAIDTETRLKAVRGEKAVTLAGLNEHVYLETGYWRAEYYEFALKDYHVGASKLLWGSGDTGSRLWYPQRPDRGARLAEIDRMYNNRNNWIWMNRESWIISLTGMDGPHIRSSVLRDWTCAHRMSST